MIAFSLLLQKTNQFNTTTRRHEAADLNALLSRPNWRCLSLKDHFGHYGLTAVAIAGPSMASPYQNRTGTSLKLIRFEDRWWAGLSEFISLA